MYFTKFCTFPTYILTTFGIRLHFSNDTYPLPSTGSYLDCVRWKRRRVYKIDFIHNWVIMGLQWMVHGWVLGHTISTKGCNIQLVGAFVCLFVCLSALTNQPPQPPPPPFLFGLKILFSDVEKTHTHNKGRSTSGFWSWDSLLFSSAEKIENKVDLSGLLLDNKTF
jgi:hypothetical protein